MCPFFGHIFFIYFLKAKTFDKTHKCVKLKIYGLNSYMTKILTYNHITKGASHERCQKSKSIPINCWHI